MKNKILTIIFFVFIVWPMYGEQAEQTNYETTAQLRISLGYDLTLVKGVSLSFAEELRFGFVPFSTATLFNLSITSVTLVYSPIKYLKLDGGYMLKLQGASSADAWDKHWSEPNNYFRHRAFVGITGTYSVSEWKFSLRERALCDMRFDDIDLLTGNKYLFTLRHYISASRSVPSYNITPYIWTELGNTLNANRLTLPDRRQYLERWRICAGTRWNVPAVKSATLTLNFFYRYEWRCSYSAKISDSVSTDLSAIIISKKRSNVHAIGIGIEL